MDQEIPLNEKIRIFSRMINDVIERNIILKTSNQKISQNQFLILRILSASGSKKVSEIADLLKISRAAASKNIDYLVKKKLLKRQTVSKDRRSMMVSLLDPGKKLVNHYNNENTNRINTILSYFNQGEKRQFKQILDKYIHHMIEGEENLYLFCLQCGGKYEGQCPVGEFRDKCYFQLAQS
jgi:DNA-binding MarR family transcriptional regulator